MYYVAICDEHEEFIQYMKALVEWCMPEEKMEFLEYRSGEELIADIKEKDCDLLILNMELKGMDGKETAKVFREFFPDTLLVFCSDTHQPTAEVFEVQPYRYWLKSYTNERMEKEVNAVLEQMQHNRVPTCVVGKKDGNYFKVHIDNVLYIELARRKSLLHCKVNQKDETYTSTMKLEEWYEQLKDFGFSYAHNSYIVNVKHVVKAGTTELELDTGEKLTIARSKLKEFREIFCA